MWMLACAAALAQDVMIEDFEPPRSVSIIGFSNTLVPAPDRTGNALQWTAYSPYSSIEFDPVAAIEPLIVTHRTLSMDVRVDASVPFTFTPDVIVNPFDSIEDRLYDYYPPVGVLVWETMDIPIDGCGEVNSGAVDFLSVYASGAVSATVWFDDLRFTGQVCRMYRDLDGDGLCEHGVDLDGDGACVQAGEPLPGNTAAVDCDDATFGGCLSLTVDPPVPGQPLGLTVSGASPGDTVGLAWSPNQGNVCPAPLGGACLGIQNPRLLGSVVADANGEAAFVLPAGAPSGAVAWMQAGVAGAPGDTSNLVQVTIP